MDDRSPPRTSALGGSCCDDCGAIVAGGRDGCQRLFDEVLAREFGDYRYVNIHRLTVDTYALQHPQAYMRSAKSFAAHLTGVCAAVERGDAAETNRAVQRWLNGAQTLTRPPDPPPRQRGDLTIVHVRAATSVEDHVGRVREWARTTWDAWRAYHPVAREWIERARTVRSPVP